MTTIRTITAIIAACTALALSAFAQDFSPASVVGRSAIVVITGGTGAFASSGAYRLVLGATTYQIVPLTSTVLPSSGTYTWTKTGANSATTVVVNAQTGLPASQGIVFSTPTAGVFSTTSIVGTQAGSFIWEGVTTTNSVSTDRIINMSVRAQVLAGSQTIPGFVLESAARVLIRVGGPALAALGVSGTLPNPKFTLFRESSAIASNDDWTSSIGNQAAVLDAASRSGAFPFAVGSRDAALVLDLSPGSYTAVITGDAGTSGEVILEVYRVP